MADFLSATMPPVLWRLISSNYLSKLIFFLLVVFLCTVLSGSPRCLLSFVAGSLVLLLSGKIRIIRFSAALVFAVVFILVAANAFFGVDFLGAIIPRVDALITLGVQGTNRSHIYEAVFSLPGRAFGYGLGNASLLLSEITGNARVVPVLNLILAVLLDAGPIGLAAILIVFFVPLVHYLLSYRCEPLFVSALAAYISWMVAGFGRIPELNPIHGIVLGILYCLMYAASRGGRHG